MSARKRVATGGTSGDGDRSAVQPSSRDLRHQHGQGVADEIASLRSALMREYVSQHGLDKEACQALEDMLYALSVEQADRLGVVDMALKAVQVGSDASPLVFFAGDQNKAKTGGE